MSAHPDPQWHRAKVENAEQKLAAMQEELAQTQGGARRSELERCVVTIEIMLPVYRQFVRCFDAIRNDLPMD